MIHRYESCALSGSRIGGFLSLAVNVKHCESPSKAGGLPSINLTGVSDPGAYALVNCAKQALESRPSNVA